MKHDYLDGDVVSVSAIPDPNYVFDHWELDGSKAGTINPYRVTMNTNHALKAVFVARTVGGIVVPVDKLGLLAPYIGLASTLAIASVASVIYVKRRKKKQ
jgi:hypothetical protein